MKQPTRYLITGGAGFIGSHLAEALLEQGDDVTVIDDLSTGRMENIQHLLDHPNFHFVRASITDSAVLDRLASQVKTIVHLAAAVGVKLVVEHPVYTIETNVMGTEAVLKAGLRYNCKVLVASTSEVYGKGSKIPFSEEDDTLLGATSKSRWSYAASKMVDEFLSLAYQREHGLQVVVFRLFNTVGPRQRGRYGMVIPNFVRQAVQGDPITVYDDGLQSRCFCDVQDVIRAIIGLAENQDVTGQVFNIGSTTEITILDLARKVWHAANPPSRILDKEKPSKALATALPQPATEIERIIFVPYDQAYGEGFEDMRRRVPDISKIKQAIGWEPQISLDETLQHLVQSYRPE
ncbi:MAG: NAD-dependent epimerase/dehydratase family protein [Chloroflexi bacterium]|nr:NAD-dependent epimerase/dehydratase family protein [Chloroflexota bacterium]